MTKIQTNKELVVYYDVSNDALLKNLVIYVYLKSCDVYSKSSDVCSKSCDA